MEGPMMQGTWVNPENGNKFTVRDSFFEDNQFRVATTDGRILDYNTIQNYVQCTDADGKEVDVPVQKNQVRPAVPQDIQDLLVPEDANIGAPRGLGSINEPPVARIDTTPKFPKDTYDPDELMVERVLRKQAKPDIEASIVWDAPVRQLDTLINMLGVEPETIVNYYLRFLDSATIMEVVKERLIQHVDKLLNPAEPMPLIPTSQAVPTPTQDEPVQTAAVFDSVASTTLKEVAKKARPIKAQPKRSNKTTKRK